MLVSIIGMTKLALCYPLVRVGHVDCHCPPLPPPQPTLPPSFPLKHCPPHTTMSFLFILGWKIWIIDFIKITEKPEQIDVWTASACTFYAIPRHNSFFPAYSSLNLNYIITIVFLPRLLNLSEPAWPGGKGAWLISGRTQVRVTALVHLSLQKLWFMDTVSWLYPAQLMKDYKMPHMAAHLNAEIILVVTV